MENKLKDLIQMKNGLKFVIKRVKLEIPSDRVLNLSSHSNCIIGNLYHNTYSIRRDENYALCMKYLFGFCISYDEREFAAFSHKFTTIQMDVNRLFSHRLHLENTITAKEWRKEAKQVLVKIKAEIKKVKGK